jgi:hypothetical protein
VLKIYDACNQRSAIQFLNEVQQRLPFRIHVVQTVNGAEFPITISLARQRTGHPALYIRPRAPRLNGEIERSHRVDEQEFNHLLDRDSETNGSNCSDLTVANTLGGM